MATVVLREYLVTMPDGMSFLVYSRHGLDERLREFRSIEPTGNAGLGSDGKATRDGKEVGMKP